MPIYMNNGATTWPKPECVARAMYDAIGFEPHHDYVNVILEQP